MHPSPLSFCKKRYVEDRCYYRPIGEIFSLKFTKYRLAAGLHPDPLGELKRSHRPPSRNKGGLLLRGGEGRGKEGEGEGEHAPRC